MEERILQAILEFKQSVETRLDSMDSKLDSMDSRLDNLESQVKENTQILRALEHSAQVAKADIDHLTYEVAEVKGDVKVIKHDLLQVERITAKNWQDITDLKMTKVN